MIRMGDPLKHVGAGFGVCNVGRVGDVLDLTEDCMFLLRFLGREMAYARYLVVEGSPGDSCLSSTCFEMNKALSIPYPPDVSFFHSFYLNSS